MNKILLWASLAFFVFGAAAPAQARFVQTDPVGYQDDPDWYNYVQDDPTDKTDPTGKEGVDELQRIDPAFGGDPNNPDPPPDLRNIANLVDFGSLVAAGGEIDASGGAAAAGPAEATEAEGHAIATELRAEARLARAAKNENHHIVPKGDRRAADARDNMRAHGIDPKSEKANQVKISGDKHDITKRNSYVTRTNDRVAEKPDADSIRQECCKIGEELTNSTRDELDKQYPPK